MRKAIHIARKCCGWFLDGGGVACVVLGLIAGLAFLVMALFLSVTLQSYGSESADVEPVRHWEPEVFLGPDGRHISKDEYDALPKGPAVSSVYVEPQR